MLKTWLGYALAVLLGLPTLWILLVECPSWQASQLPPDASATQRFEVENETRRTNVQILLGLGGIVALIAAWRRTKALEENVQVAHENTRVAQEGQITERFTRAIDQLAATDKAGNPAIEIRLGGIYALERIARDSEKDHWTVMEVLTAYVRKNAAWKDTKQASPQVSDDSGETPSDPAQPAAEIPELPIDIQAILTVLGRRERGEKREQDRQLNLAFTDLRRASLSKTHLEGVDLYCAHLEQVRLGEAHLEGADLHAAHLERANLIRAHLEGADLSDAHLEGARELTQEQLEHFQIFHSS